MNGVGGGHRQWLDKECGTQKPSQHPSERRRRVVRGDGRHVVVVGVQEARLVEPPDDVLDRHRDAGVGAEDRGQVEHEELVYRNR